MKFTHVLPFFLLAAFALVDRSTAAAVTPDIGRGGYNRRDIQETDGRGGYNRRIAEEDTGRGVHQTNGYNRRVAEDDGRSGYNRRDVEETDGRGVPSPAGDYDD
ncbi:hypothetical protein OH76DRAFT_1421650 [Lentinus brumalis]|uniref:Uncharacterized protein n=1 Tax=Lentinus brumalis TaxID=2498619 RepID=A0A371CUS5_9APHY|nr:hypothetical protein OH76DRAFT_1421650 [Polyporus brumalis]